MSRGSCLACVETIRPRQEALHCDGCDRWQHRICGTGVSRDLYRATVHGEPWGIQRWNCRGCDEPPVLEPSLSTPVDESTIPAIEMDDEPPVLEPSLPTPVDESTIPAIEMDDENATKTTTTWGCSVHNQRVWCRATVTQRGDVFTRGVCDHVHAGDNLVVKRIKIRAQVMSKAMDDVHRSAANIVETVLQEELDADDFNLPQPSYLVRAANRSRQKVRPREPTDLDFEIFQKLLDVLGGPLAVEGFVMDFDSACWNAVKKVFPQAELKGCCFHWAQAVLRKVGNIGLRTTYQRREAIHTYIRKLIALLFLPATQIAPAFHHLRALATTPETQQLTDYIDHVWMNSTVWTPSNWSVYRQSIRTNNDIEGWHRRMNGKAGRANLPFYILVPLLHREGNLVDLQMRLVSEQLLTRHQTTTYKRIQGKIFSLWDEYDGQELTTSSFLKKIGSIYAPNM